MEELQEIIDKEVENSEWVRQRKQQLEELEQCMRHKEEEVAHVDQLIDDAMRCVRGPGASRNSEEGDVRRGLPIPFRANPWGVCVVNEVNTDNYPPPHQASSPFLWPLALGWLRSGAAPGHPHGIREGTAAFPPAGPSTSARRWPRNCTP